MKLKPVLMALMVISLSFGFVSISQACPENHISTNSACVVPGAPGKDGNTIASFVLNCMSQDEKFQHHAQPVLGDKGDCEKGETLWECCQLSLD